MFRFTIRDVLWLMVVVGMAVGWKSDHNRLAASLQSSNQFREQTLEMLHEVEANLSWKIEMLQDLRKEFDEFKAKSQQSNKAD